MNKNPISPHGNNLVDRNLHGYKRQEAFENAHALPRLTLSPRNLADLICIATGIYSPLEGFASETTYLGIVNNMRLPDGKAWSIPITLQIPEEGNEKYNLDSEIALCNENSDILATMTINSKFKPDQMHEAKKVYGTEDSNHPGVAAMQNAGSVYLGGPISVVTDLPKGEFSNYSFTPQETRAEFIKHEWSSVVAFQTRNPIHRAHEYLTKAALETVDGLFINPLVGTTKTDDIPADVRMKCYEVLIAKYYNPKHIFLGTYPAAMRYAGPREAILHAISRQNYGCTHFIVGRDHAGVGDYYGTYDAQKIFDEFNKDELAITPLKFEHAFYCKRTEQMASSKTTSSTPEERVFLSGTKVREMLSQGEIPPKEFTRPEVADILVSAYAKAKSS